jgi:hypothetical protein
MVEGRKLLPLRHVFCPRRANIGMIQLGTPSRQKGELLEACSVLPLKCLPGSTPPHELVLKEGDLLHKALDIFMNRVEHCGILRLCLGYLVYCFPLR